MRYILSFLVILLFLPSLVQAQDACLVTYQDDGEIYTMYADGTNKFQLTNNAASDGGPSFSPDGTKIAFWSDRDGGKDLYLMDSDGSNVHRLTTGMIVDEPPDFQPDGQRLIFYGNPDGQRDIYRVEIDGSGIQRITSGAGTDSAGAYSPDGTKIAFQSVRDGNFEIYVMDSDGSNVIRLTNHGDIDSDPSWSPDGTKIAFFSRRTGHWETFTMDADGNNQTILLDDSFEDYRASYKDGSTFILQSNRWGGDDQIAITDGVDIIQLTTAGGERADVWCPSTNNDNTIQDTSTISITAYLDTITTQQRMQTNALVFFGLFFVGLTTLLLIKRR